MKKTLLVSLIFAVIFVGLSRFVSWAEWYFIFYSILPGIFVALFQKARNSWQIAPHILGGSIIYSLVSMLAIELLFVMDMQTSFHWSQILQASLIYGVMCLLGGLMGIVIKGVYDLRSQN